MTLSEIRAEVERLANLIGASKAEASPTYGYSEQTGRPHIEVDGEGYHYLVSERGEELQRVTTSETDELLYQVFEAITHELAVSYELHRRVEGTDPRRIIFRKQNELLALLSPEWAKRRVEGTKKILQAHPFDDDGSARAILAKKLRNEGHSPDDAWRLACEKYPRPVVPKGA